MEVQVDEATHFMQQVKGQRNNWKTEGKLQFKSEGPEFFNTTSQRQTFGEKQS